MDVIVFTAATGVALQKAIKTWLAANPSVTVSTAVQSSHPVHGAGNELTGTQIILTVFYERRALLSD